MATEADWRASVLPFTLHQEGGLSLDPKDPGNWTGGKVGLGKLLGTKYGIAAASHPGLDVRHSRSSRPATSTGGSTSSRRASTGSTCRCCSSRSTPA